MSTIIRERLRTVTLPDGRRALVIDCEIPDDAPELIREGLARRAICNSGGTCPCGATWPKPNRAERRKPDSAGWRCVDFEHDDDCPAVTETLVALIREWEASR